MSGHRDHSVGLGRPSGEIGASGGELIFERARSCRDLVAFDAERQNLVTGVIESLAKRLDRLTFGELDPRIVRSKSDGVKNIRRRGETFPPPPILFANVVSVETVEPNKQVALL